MEGGGREWRGDRGMTIMIMMTMMMMTMMMIMTTTIPAIVEDMKRSLSASHFSISRQEMGAWGSCLQPPKGLDKERIEIRT